MKGILSIFAIGNTIKRASTDCTDDTDFRVTEEDAMNVRRPMGALIGVSSGLALALVATGLWQVSPNQTGPEFLYILAAVLAVFGGTRLPDLGRSIWDAINSIGGGPGGFGPPGVPVESGLRVPISPRQKTVEPPLSPLRAR